MIVKDLALAPASPVAHSPTMGAANSHPALDAGAVEAWVFDLDNTLYPAECTLFAEVGRRMTDFVADLLALDHDRAGALRTQLFRTHGTTLRGLMIEHGIEPDAFLAYVHDVDVSVLTPNPPLAEALRALPGRKFVFTNASLAYARRVIARLGLEGRFEGTFDVAAADYVPKPAPETYRRMLARFDIDPNTAVMVEDIAKNLAPAAALGLTTVWVPSANAWAREDAAGGHIHHVVEDLTAWLTALAGDAPS